MSFIDRSDKTYNTFFEKEEKLIDTLITQNSSSKNSKSINNRYEEIPTSAGRLT